MPKRNRRREQARAGVPLAGPGAATATTPAGEGVAVATPEVPPREVGHVDTPEAAEALALRLLGPGRRWPVVVVTIASSQTEPYIDAEEIKRQVGDLGEVVVLPTGDVSWAFSHAMPRMTQVYGGAGRVYDVGHEWALDAYRSPLRFAYSAHDSARVVDLLVSDALAGAVRAGLAGGPSEPDVPATRGTVRTIVEPTTAMIVLDDDDGLPVTFRADLLDLGLPVSRLVRRGQRVAGHLRKDARRIELRRMLRPPLEYLAAYAAGDVILARVAQVADDELVLNPHPTVRVTVPRARITDNPNDMVSDLFTLGETVLARVVTPAPDMQLRLDDVDDDAHVAVPPLLEGGPPWLTLVDPRAALAEAQRHSVLEGADTERTGTVAALAAASGTAAPGLGTPAGHPPEPPPTPAQLFGTASEDQASEGTGRAGAAPPVPRGTSVPAAAGPDGASPPTGRDGAPADTDGVPDLHGETTPSRPRAVAAKPVPVAPLFGASAADTQAERQQIGEQKRTIEYLQHQLRSSEELLARREAELASQRAKYRDADKKRQDLVKKVQALTAQQAREADDLSHAFADPEEQFRFEVQLTWARMISAGEKAARPLAGYRLGPDFLRTLDALEGVSRDKVVAVVVEVLTGIAVQKSGRDLHQLRTSDGGGAPYVVRPEDGAQAWRVALQRETPQARRLHYWRLGDTYELSRVVRHDDMTP